MTPGRQTGGPRPRVTSLGPVIRAPTGGLRRSTSLRLRLSRLAGPAVIILAFGALLAGVVSCAPTGWAH